MTITTSTSARLALSIVIHHWIAQENTIYRDSRQQFLKDAIDKRSLIMELDTMTRFLHVIYPLAKVSSSNDIFNRVYERISKYVVKILTLLLEHDVSSHVCKQCEQHVTKFVKIGTSVFVICRGAKCHTIHNVILHVF
jgi:hypothetical protein